MTTDAVSLHRSICFTGAPACGLELLAADVHALVGAATSTQIPWFEQWFYLGPDSMMLDGDMRGARKLVDVANAFLGAKGPWTRADTYHILRGPLDLAALARVQGVELPPAFGEACVRLLTRTDIIAFQLPDADGWRFRGFSDARIAWFMKYTSAIMDVMRASGLRLEQLRPLPPGRGMVVEVLWRLFGEAVNPLRPSERSQPPKAQMKEYQAECLRVFRQEPGSPLGPARVA